MILLLTIAATLTWLSPLPSATQQSEVPANASSPLGTNLSKIRDYTPEFVFVDLFMSTRAWVSNRRGTKWGQGGPLDVDENGWVRSLDPDQWAEVPLLSGLNGHFPQGLYTCLHDGQGRIELRGARVARERPGEIEFEFLPGAPRYSLKIRRTDPEDPIRNIRILLPGFAESYATEPFHPTFLERWKPFRVLRFMDWMETNDSSIQSWSDRPLPTDSTQGTSKGVALEIMLQLCNTLHADPWFCMPHLADDEYVREFARMVAAGLHADGKVYIEYSNEVWNGQFAQSDHAREKGLELELFHQEWRAGWRYTAQRSVEIFAIWEEVFGGTERLVRVLAGQSSTPRTGEEILGWQKAHEHADAYAVAPYFGGRLARKQSAQILEMSHGQFMTALEGEVMAQRPMMDQNVALARKYGVSLIAYEGGQHLAPATPSDKKNEVFTNRLITANRDAGMCDLYTLYLEQWKDAGGTLFVNFSSTTRYNENGSWGVFEWFDQPPAAAPKYQALLGFIESHPAWWEPR